MENIYKAFGNPVFITYVVFLIMFIFGSIYGSYRKKIKSNIDYTLQRDEIVYIKMGREWHECHIIDINWSCRCAAIKVKGYSGILCMCISSLKRSKKQ